MYVSENDAGIEHCISLGPSRQAYLVCIEGDLTVNEAELTKRDALEAVNPSDSGPFDITLKSGVAGSHFMLMEMARA